MLKIFLEKRLYLFAHKQISVFLGLVIYFEFIFWVQILPVKVMADHF